jgi:hypothetical protein
MACSVVRVTQSSLGHSSFSAPSASNSPSRFFDTDPTQGISLHRSSGPKSQVIDIVASSTFSLYRAVLVDR